MDDTAHSAIRWGASVKAWRKDGNVETRNLVPHYLQKQPESSVLKADEANHGAKNEFLWLLKKESTGSEMSVKVQVYRLKPDSSGVAYFQIY